MKRRFPAIPLVIYPVLVQGEEAPAAIAEMIGLADRRAECDLLILARGGGSLEDLAAFNDEGVARAISVANIPIVSAIGHEIDFTIADFVADRRAATPSAAAEMASPDREELSQMLAALQSRQLLQIRQHVSRFSTRLNTLERRLGQCHPGNRLYQQQQRADELEQRLRLSIGNQISRRADRLATLSARVHAQTPSHRLERILQHCTVLNQRLLSCGKRGMEQRGQRLAALAGSLQALSPLATLERGYSVTRKLPEGEILRDTSGVSAGDRVETRLGRGRLLCRVESSATDE
jgi:exodeoxyribonuclease VII large subunit